MKYNGFRHSLMVITGIVIASCSTTTDSGKEADNPGILKAKHARPLTDVRYEATPERIAWGKYLMEGPMWCFQCHTERNKTKPGWPPLWEKRGSGAVYYKTDSTALYAPNITGDEETGIGTYTDDMIARAIRDGVGHDGRALSYAMPWANFRGLTDEDLASVVTYLRTVPPIKNKLPQRVIGPAREEELADNIPPLNGSPTVPDFSDPVSRGKYFIGISDCVGCHTGWYARNPGVFGGGNPMNDNEDHVISPNISSDSSGMGAWPVEAFLYAMENGRGKSGALGKLMPWTSYKNMTDKDLTAIYKALMTTYPIKHIVQNGMVSTHCEVCGMDHGLGDKNKIELLLPFRKHYKIAMDLSGAYVNSLFETDTFRVANTEGNLILSGEGQDWTLIPIRENYYFADGLFAPIRFGRDESGTATEFTFDDLDRSVFRKIGE